MNKEDICTRCLTDVSLIPITFAYKGKVYKGLKNGFTEAKISSRGYCDRTEYELCAEHIQSKAIFKVFFTHWEQRGAFSFKAEITATARTDVFSSVGWEYSFFAPNARLHGNYGDMASGSEIGYQPFEMELARERVRQQNTSGRPTHSYFPYYRVSSGEGGRFVVLSWQGRWFAEFSQDGDNVVFRGGQAGLESYLDEKEVVSLPLMQVLLYNGDPVNTWRRFFIDCLMSRPGGSLPRAMVSAYNGSCTDLNEQVLRQIKGWYDTNGIDYDVWWCDAGWGADGTGEKSDSGLWIYGANLEVNRAAFPDRLAWLGRELKQQQRELMLWFEAEVVRTPSDRIEEFFAYYKEFKPQWFLGSGGKVWMGLPLQWRLMDLGNPELLEWLEQKIFDVMDTAGATIFRIDFNIDPASLWDQNDTDGRRGITENKYCQGYLKLMRDIKKRYGCFMDSCASGGGRNDLETACMMNPLQYTDYVDNRPDDADGFVFMQMNLWQWLPYTRNALNAGEFNDDYLMRAKFSPMVTLAVARDRLDGEDPQRIKKVTALWEKVFKYFYGDFYHLFDAKSENDANKGYQFYCPDKKEGVAVVFTRGGTVELELIGVCAPSVTDADGKSFTLNGNRLCFDAFGKEARIFFIKQN